MTEYRLAKEVRKIAEDLVWEHHDHLSGLPIEYVMKRMPNGKAPKTMFAVKKISGLNAFLALEKKPESFTGDSTPATFVPQAGPFVVVEISQFWWGALEPWQRRGLVDHVLSHVLYDPDEEVFVVEGPEFGEFPGVLERNGDWRPYDRFKRWASRVQAQLPLLFGDEESGDEGETGDDQGSDREGDEDLDVSITFGDRTVETSTGRMRRVSEGLKDGSIRVGPNGEHVEAETGEVLEPAGAKS